MFIEQLTLENFRCFGPKTTTIDLAAGLTTFVGANGTGKTAVLQALQRLFGISNEQRRLRRQDFHVPADEVMPAASRALVLEAILAFPELDDNDADEAAVPEFFHQMAADDDGNLKCRLRLQATWTDDGSLDGTIEQTYWAVRTFGAFAPEQCTELKGADRNRIQLIYVPATRDGASQVTAFLRGRLWRAINWSDDVRTAFTGAGTTLNDAFSGEAAVDRIVDAVTQRWQQVHKAGTDTTPVFRPLDLRFQEFIRKVEVLFLPDESGRERGLDELSDGQRSLFHLAMTAATLDVEKAISGTPAASGFKEGGVALPALTLIAIEEPENNLAPFYLSRIVSQIRDLTDGPTAQALISSHSPSILTRVDPSEVRHFRLDPPSRTTRVRSITLPAGDAEASRYIREAVRSYPELYFARFVILGEGASEEVVLPILAEAMDLEIDRSFVAMVPLGGRHVNHLWRLLTDLDIPYATLLDLDWGRSGGGWGRIKTTCEQLLANGVLSSQLFTPQITKAPPILGVKDFATREPADTAGLKAWMTRLNAYHVFFSMPLDLDWSMLKAFPAAYKVLDPGATGPSTKGDPRVSVLGDEGLPELYDASYDEPMKWYRYLFLGRGKPSTHVRALSGLTAGALEAGAPADLKLLLNSINERLSPDDHSGLV